mmetsp:Transcript_22437/g.31190  ORF Transcript_22437/g.31190 Transcript_22437/m.31190 type:complete len:115 (-) Transcript_22437:312-656(-)|eukprot:CAMPEP_0196591968 /NCGR_PEP_ID=MMETSP1081-20130531/71454_1 /TAXON_ID=36882 /ORGANISM="Pyramimonas amylifera, Strain CCMP720" /LENGTH=114 /DNA_ID=CAMNT_0041915513 /DNA_START=94 /DNA_END=438 /DNA_ORIENTATION=+
MTHLPKFQEFNQFKPEPNPPGVTTPGIHTGQPYVPSSDMAWGPKGKWEGKSWSDVSFERQVAKTHCSVKYNGMIDDARTWESRGKEEDSTFRPNVKNLAPRPKNWQKGLAPTSY